MIATSKNRRYTNLQRLFVLPVFLLVITLLSYTIVNAQHDPRLNPGPVKIQKLTVNKKTPSVNNRNSLVDIKIDYNKPDSTPAILTITTSYAASGKNNDPVKTTIKQEKATIYDEESQQQRDAGEDEVRQIVEQVIQNPPKSFIYFLDGAESTIESIKKLNPDKITTINFFKNEEAVKKYGEKARTGVIVLTTK